MINENLHILVFNPLKHKFNKFYPNSKGILVALQQCICPPFVSNNSNNKGKTTYSIRIQQMLLLFINTKVIMCKIILVYESEKDQLKIMSLNIMTILII